MKKTIVLSAILALALGNYCKAKSRHIHLKIHATYLQQDSLAIYTGKYESVQKKGTASVEVAVVDGALIATASWDGSKIALKPLRGDNFIASGYDWSIKFTRDKDNHIAQMTVAGSTVFTKVKK